MTAYCTQADLAARYGEDELIQTTDRAFPPAGAVDTVTVQRACDDASAVVDSFARGRYQTPLATANVAVVLPWVCAIARWLLHEDGHPEHVEHAYKAAIDWLKDLAAGRVGLPDATPPEPPADGGAFGVAVQAPAVVFTARTLGAMP